MIEKRGQKVFFPFLANFQVEIRQSETRFAFAPTMAFTGSDYLSNEYKKSYVFEDFFKIAHSWLSLSITFSIEIWQYWSIYICLIERMTWCTNLGIRFEMIKISDVWVFLLLLHHSQPIYFRPWDLIFESYCALLVQIDFPIRAVIDENDILIWTSHGPRPRD